MSKLKRVVEYWPVEFNVTDQYASVDKVWELIEAHNKQSTTSGNFSSKRKKQNKYWLLQTVEDHLKRDFFENTVIKKQLKNTVSEVMEGKISPFKAAEQLLALHRSKPN